MSSSPHTPGPLGWISPRDRTQAQQDAHERCTLASPKFALPPVQLAKGDKIILTKAWSDPQVIADVGLEFNGFYQFTGSCVGVSAGNCVFTLSALQRLFSVNATKAFIPFWPYDYGMTRMDEGDRGQGEGAVDSVMAARIMKGVLDSAESGLPKYNRTSDGMQLNKSTEMIWSNGAAIDAKWAPLAAKFPLGSATPLSDVEQIAQSIIGGNPVLDGCDNFCRSGTIKGSGDTTYVSGRYDGHGGHSTCFLGVWEHPNDGRLFLYSNQWPTQTYPADPAGGGRCTVWLPESEVTKLFRTGGSNGETVGLSHLAGLAIQPAILDWMQV